MSLVNHISNLTINICLPVVWKLTSSMIITAQQRKFSLKNFIGNCIINRKGWLISSDIIYFFHITMLKMIKIYYIPYDSHIPYDDHILYDSYKLCIRNIVNFMQLNPPVHNCNVFLRVLIWVSMSPLSICTTKFLYIKQVCISLKFHNRWFYVCMWHQVTIYNRNNFWQKKSPYLITSCDWCYFNNHSDS